MPDAQIPTDKGFPFLDDWNFLHVVPQYTRDLRDYLQGRIDALTSAAISGTLPKGPTTSVLGGDLTWQAPTAPALAITAKSGWTIDTQRNDGKASAVYRAPGGVLTLDFVVVPTAERAAGEHIIAGVPDALNAHLRTSRRVGTWIAIGGNGLSGTVVWDRATKTIYLHTAATIPVNMGVHVSFTVIGS